MSDKVHPNDTPTVADPLTQPMTQNSETDNSEIMKDQIMGDTYDIDFSDVSSYYTLDKKGTPKKSDTPTLSSPGTVVSPSTPKRALTFLRPESVSTGNHPRYTGVVKKDRPFCYSIMNIYMQRCYVHMFVLFNGFVSTGAPRGGYPNYLLENILLVGETEYFSRQKITDDDIYYLVHKNSANEEEVCMTQGSNPNYGPNKPQAIFLSTAECLTLEEQKDLNRDYINALNTMKWNHQSIKPPGVQAVPNNEGNTPERTPLSQWIGVRGCYRLLKSWFPDFQCNDNWGLKDEENLRVLEQFYPKGTWTFKHKVMFGVPDDWLSQEGLHEKEDFLKAKKQKIT